jgi:hypothetical protein
MIDLHHHFDGAFETEALYREARRRNLPQGQLSPDDFAARCRVPKNCNSLTDFLAVLNFFMTSHKISISCDSRQKNCPNVWRRPASFTSKHVLGPTCLPAKDTRLLG